MEAIFASGNAPTSARALSRREEAIAPTTTMLAAINKSRQMIILNRADPNV